VWVIVNDDREQYIPHNDDLASDWDMKRGSSNSVRYLGSTTGTSYNNKYCSPYQVTWFVDRDCNKLSARSFDKMCADLAALGLEADLEPHSSRELVLPKFTSAEPPSTAL
jgi:hypothetical protein